MKYLGLDVGTRRTGVAFADSDDDILFSLPTIEHTSKKELMKAIEALVAERHIDQIVLGLPLLPDGSHGSQAAFVESIGEDIERRGIPFVLLDERYTTQDVKEIDGDAASACTILSVQLDRIR